MIILPLYVLHDWLKTESIMSVVDVTSFYFLALLQNVVETLVLLFVYYFLNHGSWIPIH